MKTNVQKIRKTTLAVLLSAIAVISVNAQKVGDKFKEGKLYYKITKLDPKEVEVSNQKGSYPYYDNAEKPTGNITIPQTAQGYTVTAIGSYAFGRCKALTSVIIPESVTKIGGYAFYDIGATTITIPKSVTTLSDKSFARFYSLTEIKVATDNPNYSVQNGVLFNKEQTKLIAFPAGKTDTEYTIPNTVTDIGTSAFYSSKLNTVTIKPNTIKVIGEYAFSESKLKSIVIPDGVTSIGYYCFYNCDKLKTISISKTVVTSMNYLFSGNLVLQSITVATDNPNYSSKDGILFDKEQHKLIAYPLGKANTHYTIPNTVTSIENLAFNNSQNLTSITIPNSVKAINGWGALSINLTAIISKIEDIKSVTMGIDVFFSTPKDKCKLYVPKGTIDAYKKAAQWKDFKNIIEEVAVTQVTLNPKTAELKVGETATLTATVEPSDATNKNVTWSSSDDNIATVDASGLVTAVAEGNATITVTTEDGSKTATCEITVTPKTIAVTKVTLSPKTAELKVGETTTLTATVEPNDATNKNVTWSSSDDNIATVDVNGLVTAVAEGTATITVTTEDGSKTATCEITVTPKTIAVTKVILSPQTAELKVGETTTLTATVEPNDATNKNVTWSSSDDNIAKVDANGLVTAVAEGTATITVTTEDGGKTATCKVTVTNGSGTGINNNIVNNIKIYPTLVSNGFVVETSQVSKNCEVWLLIYDQTGKKVKEVQLTSQKQFVDVSNLQSDVYVTKIGNEVIKFVKK